MYRKGAPPDGTVIDEEERMFQAPSHCSAGRVWYCFLHAIGNVRSIHHAVPGTHGESWISIGFQDLGVPKPLKTNGFRLEALNLRPDSDQASKTDSSTTQVECPGALWTAWCICQELR